MQNKLLLRKRSNQARKGGNTSTQDTSTDQTDIVGTPHELIRIQIK